MKNGKEENGALGCEPRTTRRMKSTKENEKRKEHGENRARTGSSSSIIDSFIDQVKCGRAEQ